MGFRVKTSLNGSTLQLVGDTQGSIGVSSKFANGQLTVTLKSNKDLSLAATGNLDATVIGGAENDTFDFSGATGDYVIRTGLGTDKVIDGVGNNTFDGEGGADTFVFNKVEGGAVEEDWILNFVALDDSIDIGAQAPSAIDDLGGGHVTIAFADGDIIHVQGTGVTKAVIESELGLV
jgi:hypothetical protein